MFSHVKSSWIRYSSFISLLADCLLMLTKAQNQGGKRYWTTVSEERDRSRQDAVLAEAAILGNLIREYYSTSLAGDLSKKKG